jgi:hypothetical protein
LHFSGAGLNDFNPVVAADLSGLDHAAENAPAPAYRILKSRPNFIHLVAWRAGLGDFQQRFTYLDPLPRRQSVKSNPVSRDVFLHTTRRDAELFERLLIHQENLPAAAAPPVDAVLETFVFDREDLARFADRLAVGDRLKQVKNFSHEAHLRQHAIS